MGYQLCWMTIVLGFRLTKENDGIADDGCDARSRSSVATRDGHQKIRNRLVLWNHGIFLVNLWLIMVHHWNNNISGWCFGTWIWFFPFSWECHNPNWRTHRVFFRGVGIPPTSIYIIIYIYLLLSSNKWPSNEVLIHQHGTARLSNSSLYLDQKIRCFNMFQPKKLYWWESHYNLV